MQCDSRAGGVYLIIHTFTGREYVGSTKNFHERCWQHENDLRVGRHVNLKLLNSWRLHPAKEFDFRIYREIPDLQERIAVEQWYIDTFHPYYNIALIVSSTAGIPRTPETRAKISAARKGTVFSLLHRARLSAAKKGKSGRIVTEAERQKRSLSQQGKKRSPEIIQRMSEIGKRVGISRQCIERARELAKDKPLSAERRAKISASLMGHESFGPIKHTKETRAKISATRKAKGIRNSPEVNARMAETKRRYFAEHPEARDEMVARARRGIELRELQQFGRLLTDEERTEYRRVKAIEKRQRDNAARNARAVVPPAQQTLFD